MGHGLHSFDMFAIIALNLFNRAPPYSRFNFPLSHEPMGAKMT